LSLQQICRIGLYSHANSSDLESRKTHSAYRWCAVFSSFPGKDVSKSYGLGTHLFVNVPRPGDSEGTFLVFGQATTCYYQSNHSKVSALPKDTASELDGLRGVSSEYPFLMLNVKQGNCEYQLLKYFCPTRPGNRNQIYRLRDRRSNYKTLW